MGWRTRVQVSRANLHCLQRAGQFCSRVARASWKQHIQNKLRRSRCIPGKEGKLGLRLGAGTDTFLSSCCTRCLPEVVKNPVLKIHRPHRLHLHSTRPGSPLGSSPLVRRGAGLGRGPAVTQQPQPVDFHGYKPASLGSPCAISHMMWLRPGSCALAVYELHMALSRRWTVPARRSPDVSAQIIANLDRKDGSQPE